jgi:glycine reductase
MTREIELAGIPTAQICTMTPVASLVGANRIIPGNGIVQPTGDASLEPAEEQKMRRTIIETALESLQEEIKEQKLYPRPV